MILNSHRATHVYLIQNKIFQQSPEKAKHNGEHERQYQHFSVLSHSLIL